MGYLGIYCLEYDTYMTCPHIGVSVYYILPRNTTSAQPMNNVEYTPMYSFEYADMKGYARLRKFHVLKHHYGVYG